MTAERPFPVRPFLLAIVLCAVLGGLGGLLAAELESPRAETARFIPPLEPARDFRLRDQDGRWTTLADARGQVVILTFLYSSCRDLCPAQAGEIVQAVGQIGDGVMVYGVSVDPVGDTQQRARRWLERFGLYGGPVRFLVGNREELAPVWRGYGIVPIGATHEEAAAAAETADRLRAAGSGPYRHPWRGPPSVARDPYPRVDDFVYRGRTRHVAGWDFEHSAYVMLIDKHGRQRVGLPFEQLEAAELAEDVRLLQRER
jgi:protein SCO1/2